MPNENKTLPAIALLLDGARGIYIPRDFVLGYDLSQWQGIDADDAKICANPDDELYWESWERILDNAVFEHDGYEWRLYQDGDLWAVCSELMSDEEKQAFGFED